MEKKYDEKLNAEIVKGSVKEKLNYAMPGIMKFYEEINPHLTTNRRGVVYFNTKDMIDDNAFPQKLVDYYNEASPTHSSLVNLKYDLLVGGGLIPQDEFAVEFLLKENKFGDNLQDVWNKMCMDYAILESYALQIIYSKGGGLSELVHTDMSKVRAQVNDDFDEQTSIIKNWLLSNHWARITNKRYKKFTSENSAISIPEFNRKDWSKDSGLQMVVCRKYTPNAEVYSIPSYVSVLNYVLLEHELSKFHLNKITGGLFANAIVYLPGNPGDEEKRRFINEFKKKYQGSDNEKLMFIWGEFSNEAELPKVIPFSTQDQDEVFQELDKIITQKIITAHRAIPELAGIQSDGADLGGDANKINVSRAYYIQTVIEPMRKPMLDTLNKVLRTIEGSKGYKVDNEELHLINTEEKDDDNTDNR